jgi:hypothetical protein
MRLAVFLAALLPAAFARHRLEPATPGAILHGGGSGEADFQPYAAYMGALAPSLYMVYIGLSSLNATPPGAVAKDFLDLNATLTAYGDAATYFLVPQIGLALPHGADLKKVGQGEVDAGIAALVTGLAALARPAFVRIGYEFNGMGWNDYSPGDYVAAWRRIATAVRAGGAAVNASTALVWDRTCDDTNDDKPWWPGDDDMVDWFGVNIYSSHSAPGDTGCVAPFLADAASRGFPVMLGEVAPRGKTTADAGTWDSWFAPYFGTLLGLDGAGDGAEGAGDGATASRPANVRAAASAPHPVRAVSYINRNWDANPAYKGWGDSRVHTPAANASGVAARYVARMGNSAWVNKRGQADMLAALGLAPAA